MLLQTNSYIVPKEKRGEHSRLLRRFRAALSKLGCDNFEVYEQVSSNWTGSDANGRYVQIMRFRNRQHQVEVQQAERNDPTAQSLIREFCELINFPYQQQQGLFAVGYYTSVLPVVTDRADEALTDVGVENPAPAAEPMMAAPEATAETEMEQPADQPPISMAGPAAPEPLAEADEAIAEEDIFSAESEPIPSDSTAPAESAAPIDEQPEHHPEPAGSHVLGPADSAMAMEDEGIATESPAPGDSNTAEPLSLEMPGAAEPAHSNSNQVAELGIEESPTQSDAIGEALDRALDADGNKFPSEPVQTQRSEENEVLDDDAALEALSDRQLDAPPLDHDFHHEKPADFGGQNGNGKLEHESKT